MAMLAGPRATRGLMRAKQGSVPRRAHRLGGEPIDHFDEGVARRPTAAQGLGIKRQLPVGTGAAGDDPAAHVEFRLAAESFGVVGHESVHDGDPVAQTEETMCNVESVLDASRTGARVASLRTYVRNADHTEAIRRELDRLGYGALPNAWYRADICRRELLVEIEAVAR